MKKRIIAALLSLLMVLTLTDFSVLFGGSAVSAAEKVWYQEPEVPEGTFVRYLSDLSDGEIVRKQVGWGSYMRNLNSDGGELSLMVGGVRTYFESGVAAHAKADLIYDLGSTDTFQTFSAFLGLDAAKGNKPLASISIQVSNTPADSASWVELYNTGFMTGTDEAKQVSLSLMTEEEGVYYRYLRIYCDPGEANSYDHTVICGAKLSTSLYDPEEEKDFGRLEEYDAVLEEILNGAGEKSYGELFFDASDGGAEAAAEARLALMQRTLMSMFGSGDTGFYYLTLSFLRGEDGEDHRAFLKWLLNDEDALAEFLAGGEPNGGSYIGALKVFSDLYTKYGSDLDDGSALFSGDGTADPALVQTVNKVVTAYDGQADDPSRTKGDVYQTLMIAIALTCDTGLYSWLNQNSAEDPVERYRVFRMTYLDSVNHLRHDIFENLEVEEMRWVVGSRAYNTELYWLNYYCRQKSKSKYYTGVYSPHQFLRYGKDWHWGDYGYYDEENYSTYNEQYLLTVYSDGDEDEEGNDLYAGVPYSTIPRTWMVFGGSHICWGISYTGTTIAAAFGVPSHYVLQPGHAAFFKMERDLNGNITWGIDNNISGWTKTTMGETVGKGNARMMCDWGTWKGGWTSYWCGSYLMLSQYAMNHYDAYEKAELLMDMEGLMTTADQKEKLYRDVLELLPTHLDAWYGLVTLYQNNKTVTEIAELSKELREAMQYFPLPMHDLMALLKNGVNAKSAGESDSMTVSEALAYISFQESLGYDAGSLAKSSCSLTDLNQPDVCVTMANYLKGQYSGTLATFSFTGENAGQLVFGEDYEGVRFRYSLDGGESWTASGLHTTSADSMSWQLTEAELSSITADDDILIWLEGWPYEDGADSPTRAPAFCIDILEGSALSSVELNDNENRLVGSVDWLAYSEDSGETWHEYTADTRFDGDRSVIFHRVRNGVTLQGADSDPYTFTADTDTAERSYVYIENLTLYDFSSEQTNQNDYARHVIDGRLATRWHTYWNGSDTARYITIKTDEPMFFSGIDYTPVSGGGNGTFTACSVYVSVDGSEWYLAGQESGWTNDGNKKSMTFEEPAYGQYIKIVADGYVGSSSYASARLIEIFEDTTFAGKTIAGVRLATAPAKSVYMQGEAADISGARVECVYTDGSCHVVPHAVLSLTPEIMTETGSQTLSIRYLDQPPVTVSVFVTENTRTAETAEIETLPGKLTYFPGISKADIDLSGIRLLLSDKDGSWYSDDCEVIKITAPKAEESQEEPEEADTLTEGTWVVTLETGGLFLSYEITVTKKPVSLKVTAEPDRTEYNIGDILDLTGLKLTVTYTDGSQASLDQSTGGFSFSADGFSALPGDRSVKLSLDALCSVTAEFSVRVLSNLYDGDFQYDVLECAGEPKTYQCYLSAYTDELADTVSVPASVTRNGVTYQVIGVRKGAFASAPGVKNLSLPGSLEILEEGSLSDLTSLENLYLTGIADIGNLTIEDGALPEENENSSTIYMASDALQTDLDGELEDYVTGSGEPITEKMKTGDIIGDGQIRAMLLTPPDKTDYELCEAEDLTGLRVDAELINGIVLPMEAGLSYTASGFDSSVYGEKTVTVSLTDTELTDRYRIRVLSTAPKIAEHPKSAVYLSKELTAEALSVTVQDTSFICEYQWYWSGDSALDPENDRELTGETGSSYVPVESGWYYVKAVRLDSASQKSDPVYSMAAHVQIEDFPLLIEGDETQGFFSLHDAFLSAKSGDVILARSDFYVGKCAYTAGKKLTLKGSEGVTGYREDGYTGTFIEVNGGSLVITDLTLSGGAVWTGTEDAVLKRGNENSGTATSSVLLKATGAGQLTLGAGSVIRDAAASGSIWGAAVYVSGTAGLLIDGGTIRDCSTTYTADTANGSPGAAVLNESTGTVELRSGLITGCYAVRGGAVGIYGNSSCFLMSGGTIENCSAVMGGAVCAVNGSAYLSGGTIENCSAVNGGGVCVSSGNAYLQGGTIRACTAATGGGGGIATLYTTASNRNLYGQIIVRDGTIESCTAGYIGGAVYSSSAGQLRISGGSFLNNTAKWGGAAGTNSASTVETEVSGGVFRGNSATLGSAVFIGGASKLILSGGLFGDNVIPAGGSLIGFYNAGTHTITGGTFLYGDSYLNASAASFVSKRNAVSLTITGGTFSSVPSDVASGYGVLKLAGDSALYRVAADTDELIFSSGSGPSASTGLSAATLGHAENAADSLAKILAALSAAVTDEALQSEIPGKQASELRIWIYIEELGDGSFNVTPYAQVTLSEGPVSAEIPADAVFEKVCFRLPADQEGSSGKSFVKYGDTNLGLYLISEDGAGCRYSEVYADSFGGYELLVLPESAEDAEQVTDESLRTGGAEFSPDESLEVLWRASAEGYTDVYAELTVTSAERTVSTIRLSHETDPDTGEFLFRVTELTPQRMNDRIRFTLYGRKDGKWFAADGGSFSVKQYCMDYLTDAGTDTSKDRLLSALLRYGAAAQAYYGYEADDPVTADFARVPRFTAADTDHSEDSAGSVKRIVPVSGGVNIVSAALLPGNDTGILIRFTLEPGTDIGAVTFTDSFTGESTGEFIDFGGEYGLLIKGIGFSLCSRMISFTSFVSGVQDDQFFYSVNSYLLPRLRQTDAAGELYRAMYSFGCEAAAYQAAE